MSSCGWLYELYTWILGDYILMSLQLYFCGSNGYFVFVYSYTRKYLRFEGLVDMGSEGCCSLLSLHQQLRYFLVFK